MKTSLIILALTAVVSAAGAQCTCETIPFPRNCAETCFFKRTQETNHKALAAELSIPAELSQKIISIIASFDTTIETLAGLKPHLEPHEHELLITQLDKLSHVPAEPVHKPRTE